MNSSIEQRLRVAAAQSLSLLQRYQEGERTWEDRERMIAEAGLIIGWLLELGLPPDATEAGILRPVGAHLIAQYGREAGRGLLEEFVAAFERAGLPPIAGASHGPIEGA